MARLPIPGSDSGQWGTILNDFLSQSHTADGKLKTDSVTAAQLASGSVVNSAIANGAVTTAKIADGTIASTKLDASAQASLVKADTALQPGGLALVATSGAYSDLSGQPTLGTAASTNSTDYAPALGLDENYVTDVEKAALHAHSNKTALDLVSGTNTGDQTLPTWSTLANKPAVIAAGATAADARSAIGAGTSSFSGSYSDLTDKPTIPADAADHTSGSATTGQVLTADGSGGAAWESSASATGITVGLTVVGWSANAQTVTATGVTASSLLVVAPTPADQVAYVASGIICTTQGTDSLTFTCTTTPTTALDVQVVIL